LGTEDKHNEPPAGESGFIRVWACLLILLVCLLSACATAPPNYFISCTNITGSGEGHITYKADSDQKPTTTNKTDVKPQIAAPVGVGAQPNVSGTATFSK
jgi:hypothetical protein